MPTWLRIIALAAPIFIQLLREIFKELEREKTEE